MPKKDKDFIIVPEQNAVNAEFQYVNDAYTTINGRTTSTLTPNDSNIGGLSGFAFGSTTNTNEYIFRIQDSGSLYSSTYGFKKSGEADSLYRGTTDPGTYTVSCVPYYPYSGHNGQGAPVGLFSKVNKKEYLFIPTMLASNTSNPIPRIYIYSRNASDDGSNFEIKPGAAPADFPFQMTEILDSSDVSFDTQSNEIRNACIDVCELSNGTIRLAVVNNGDIDLYHSTDCENFTLIAENIIERFIFSDERPNSLKIAASGNYLRIVYVESTSIVRTLVSVDLGATWKETSNENIGLSIGETPTECPPSFADSNNRWSIQLVGTDDSTGEFLLVVGTWFYYCYGTQAFNEFTVQSLDKPVPLLGPQQFGDLIYSGTRWFIADDSDYIWVISELSSLYNANNRAENWQYNPSNTFPQQSIERMVLLIDKKYPLSQPRIICPSGSTWAAFQQPYNNVSGATLWATMPKTPSSGYRGCKRDRIATGKAYRVGSGIAFIYQNYRSKMLVAPGFRVGGSYLNNSSRTMYERYGNWSVCPLNPYIRYKSSYIGGSMETGYPKAPYKNIIRGQWWWHQWDCSCGPPDPFIPNSVNPNLPSDSVVSGGAYTNSSGESAYSIWQETASGTAHYYDPYSYQGQGFRVMHPKNSNGLINWSTKGKYVGMQHPDYLAGTHSSMGLSPQRCWGYNINGVLSNMDNNGPHGVLAEWCMSTQAFGIDTAGVKIQTYAYKMDSMGMERYATTFFIYCMNDTPGGSYAGKVKMKVIYWDGASYITHATFEIDTSDALPLQNYNYIFRLACSPTKNETTNTWNFSVKRTGTNTWSHFSFSSPDNRIGGSQDQQEFVWGCVGENTHTSNIWSCWQYVRISEGNPFNVPSYAGQFSERTFPDIVKGRLSTGSATHIEDGQYICWAGSGAMENDLYTLSPNYVYKPTNALKFESPQTQLRITNEDNSNNSEIVFRAQTATGSTYCTFNHNSWAAFNTNANILKLEYAGTTSGSWDLAGYIYMQRARGRITSAGNDTVTVDWDTDTSPAWYRQIKPNTLSSTDGKTNYLYWETPQGGSQFAADAKFPKYKIEKHIGLNRLVLSSDREAYKGDLNTNNVGTTVMLYSSSGCYVGNTNHIGPYMRITTYGSNIAPEGYLKIGTLVAGSSLTLDVELDWESSETYSANVSSYQTSSGIRWGYAQGPTGRQFKGVISGDIDEQERRQIRNMIDSSLNISKFPLVLSINNGNYPDYSDFLLGTFDQNYVEKNDGWYYDDAQERWLPVGSLSVKITESV